MDWQLGAAILAFVLAVVTVERAEGKIATTQKPKAKLEHLSPFSGFVSCSPNPCENGARCIKNSLGSARCE